MKSINTTVTGSDLIAACRGFVYEPARRVLVRDVLAIRINRMRMTHQQATRRKTDFVAALNAAS